MYSEPITIFKEQTYYYISRNLKKYFNSFVPYFFPNSIIILLDY